MTDPITELEEELRDAMLTADVEVLDRLIDDRLLFVGPDGSLARKEDDLASHRAGGHRFTKLEVLERKIERFGDTVVVCALTDLGVVMGGHTSTGRYRYVRTWMKVNASWRIVAGSVSAVTTPPASP